MGEPIEIPYISAFPKIGIASGIGPTFKDSLTPIIKSHKWGIELQPMGALDNKFKSLWSEIKFMPKIDSGWKGAGIASGWKATITSVANLHSGLTGIAKPFAELNSGTGSIAKSKFPLINGTKRFRSGVDFGTDSLAYPLTGAKAIPFINSIVQVDPNPKISILPKDNAFTLAYGTRPKLLYGTVHR